MWRGRNLQQKTHRINIEIDLQNLFGLMSMYTALLTGAFGLIYEGAIRREIITVRGHSPGGAGVGSQYFGRRET